jgi:hypothetical protein
MYGLKEAGKLSNLRLVSLLQAFDFFQTTTPGLFRHATRPITFVLVVDDFGVKYHHPSDFAYLVSCLSTLYHVKAHPIASSFLGFSLSHNRSSRTFTVSYPGYVSTLLTRLRPSGITHTSSPSIYIPPSYGSAAPQCPTTLDNSPPATPCQAKELQIAIGYLLYYGRAVDARVLPATCALASEQASPTAATIARLDRLLGYTAAHPNGRKIFRASDMVLRCYSDASYLSRPRAGSVAGGHHFLGDLHDDAPLNHPISTHCTRIPVVCSFVAEAEYAGTFASARIATNERQILADMGHPQPPTPIFCDNEVAIGLATDSINLKMSKSIDMRWHWVRDRIRQGHFRAVFVPGISNHSDFFTKALPVARHKLLAPFSAVDPDDDVASLFSNNLNILSCLYDAL